ncbi:MAG: hypothetical protein ACO1OO_10510 [Flavisolibacter sp.]
MEEKNYTGLIPENVEGRAITATAQASFGNEASAKAFYATARERLLSVHNWGKIAGPLSADFSLTDDEGHVVVRPVQRGDRFRIDIPGPGSSAGEGYDWARVEDVKEASEERVDSIAILVRPAQNPMADNEHVAHFFSSKSTSTFVVTREGAIVTAAIYDRNIEANEETKHLPDKLRNAVVGLGAKHGISKLQWQALVDALLQRDEKETGLNN